MKILIVADHESRYIWDFFDPERYKDIDLVLSAGDLKRSYLEFLTTVMRVPVYYIHGNHDTEYLSKPPGGCTAIDDQLITVKGIRILGLGGSQRYKDGPLQYTEADMVKRVRRLKRKIKKADGFDILLTHAPAMGIGDGLDTAHQGFDIFNQLIDVYEPSYFIHGHQHLNYNLDAKRLRQHGHTTIINGYEYHILEYTPNHHDFDHEKKMNLKISWDMYKMKISKNH